MAKTGKSPVKEDSRRGGTLLSFFSRGAARDVPGDGAPGSGLAVKQQLVEAVDDSGVDLKECEDVEIEGATCPICEVILDGMSEEERMAHVDLCLRMDDDEDDLPQPPEIAVKQEPGIKREDSTLSIQQSQPSDQGAQACPICARSLSTLSTGQASFHVNACLDLGLSSQPHEEQTETQPPAPAPTPLRPTSSSSSSPNPFSNLPSPFLAPSTTIAPATPSAPTTSAFSKLMSKNPTEEKQWARAAERAKSEWGKPAATRKCPFYKILTFPSSGASLVVDGFKYGKVPGIDNYFLTHYHSDHYGGLSHTWSHGVIWCSRITARLVIEFLRVDPKWVKTVEMDVPTDINTGSGLTVTAIDANHCPGSVLFLFEHSLPNSKKTTRYLHCGDFRAHPRMVTHPAIKDKYLDGVWLDTTYLNPKYAFPPQEEVVGACAELCRGIAEGKAIAGLISTPAERGGLSRFLPTLKKESTGEATGTSERGRLLVVVGTYSIGKERIVIAIAQALSSKIYAPARKRRMLSLIDDPLLSSLITDDPSEAQVHMVFLSEVGAEGLRDYLKSLGGKGGFERVVGFRPTGWTFTPGKSRTIDSNPPVREIIDEWRNTPPFTPSALLPLRGSTPSAICFGVPYSEHSSFRELTCFVSAVRVGRIVPTVNVGTERGRERMRGWVERWEGEKVRSGRLGVREGQEGW
ncbi:hypothetical protein YB2330_003017 [Saitoella coloradoensis]